MSTEKDTIAIILDDVLAFHKQMEKVNCKMNLNR